MERFFIETLKDEKYGPICISLKREKLDERARKEKSVYIYRIIVRTASLMVLKGSILEELVPLGRNSYVVSQRDVLMHLLPEININNLRKLTPDGSPNLLINLDSKSEQTGLKIGVLLCKAGQSTEEEMYNNQHSTPLFDQERINIAPPIFKSGLMIPPARQFPSNIMVYCIFSKLLILSSFCK